MSDPRQDPAGESEWRVNYFNYFTEVEEHFQRARGTSLFLLSPLDWALVEAWKNAGVPLEAVLRGIDAAFEKWRSRKTKTQEVNSLAYCAQAVLKEAEAMANNVEGGASAEPAESPFTAEPVRKHLEEAVQTLENRTEYREIVVSLRGILDDLDKYLQDSQELELRLTALEDKMGALARTVVPENVLLDLRRELEFQLRPYRGKLSSEQLIRLEKSFLDRRLYETLNLPRLSLFYLK